MSTLLIFWICTSILFLIVEMITVTFYGLAIAVAAGTTALYVWLVGQTEVSVMQGLIFVIVSVLASYFLPKWLVSATPDKPQGLDNYLGEVRKVKKIADDYKIALDGVDYAVQSRDDLEAGDKVKVVGRDGATMKVEKI